MNFVSRRFVSRILRSRVFRSRLFSGPLSTGGGGGGGGVVATWWQDFEFDAAAGGVTAAALNARTGGGLNWAVTDGANRMSTTGSPAQMTEFGNVNGSPDNGTRGVAIVVTGGEDSHVTYDWLSSFGTTPCSFNFKFRFTNNPDAESTVYIFAPEGNGDYVCRVRIFNDGGGNVNFGMRGDAGFVNHSTNLSTNTTYSVSVYAQASGTCKMQVYNTSNVELGTEITVNAADSSQRYTSMGLVGAYSPGAGIFYFDNLTANNATAPWPYNP